MNTDFLKLQLTDKSETSMTFIEWRTLMNGTQADSNMMKLDEAIKELNDENGRKADGFRLDKETGSLQLTSGGKDIGQPVKLDLNEYLKYEFTDELPDSPVEGKTYYVYVEAGEDGMPLYTAHQYKDGQWIQVGGAGRSVDTSQFGVEILSFEEDGVQKQYLVNAN